MDAIPNQSSEPSAPAVAPPPRRRRLPRLTLPVAVAVLAVDQLTKWLAVNYLVEPVDLVWTLQLSLTYNTGTAFSLGLGLGPFIGVAAVLIVLALVRLGRTVVSPLGAVALGLVMGGAVGNLADRVFRARDGVLDGAVIDFIDLQWWPVFNVADMAIVVGGVLLAVSGFGTDRSAAGGSDRGPPTSRDASAADGPVAEGGMSPPGSPPSPRGGVPGPTP